MSASEHPLLSPAQARSLTKVWSGGFWRAGMTRELAVAVVKAWLKSKGFYPDGALLWLPKPGRDSVSVLKEAPREFSFPAVGVGRWKLSGTRLMVQYKRRSGYKSHASESLFDFAGMLLALAADITGEEKVQAAARRYELKQDRQRAHNRGHPDPSPSRERAAQCLAEAWRRTLAGCPASPAGAPGPWLPAMLWELGWGDRWRFWEGDSYLQAPPAYLFAGGPAKQAFWYQDLAGNIVPGGKSAVVCVELLSHAGQHHASQGKATVVISTAGEYEPRPVIWGTLSCSSKGALRGAGVERRMEGGDPHGHAARAWDALVGFYRGLQ